MKKYFLAFVLLLINASFFSQCPVGVQITANPANPVCKNTSVQLTAGPTNGGVSPQYFWILNGDTIGLDSTVTTSVDFAFVELIMISSNGCIQDTAITNYTVINTVLVADYNVIVTECNQPVAEVEILGIAGTPIGVEPYTYDLITSEGALGQQLIYKDLPVSSYPIIITDGQGCMDTTWINMDVYQCPPPNPTEVITPNEDGYNDVWRIQNIEFYPNNEVFIFDRWGQRVYQKKGYDNNNGWDAKYLGLDMPVSTYYYIIKIEFEKRDELVFNGPISVFR